LKKKNLLKEFSSQYKINPLLEHTRSKIFNKIVDAAEKKVRFEKFYYLEQGSSTENSKEIALPEGY